MIKIMPRLRKFINFILYYFKFDYNFSILTSNYLLSLIKLYY